MILSMNKQSRAQTFARCYKLSTATSSQGTERVFASETNLQLQLKRESQKAKLLNSVNRGR